MCNVCRTRYKTAEYRQASESSNNFYFHVYTILSHEKMLSFHYWKSSNIMKRRPVKSQSDVIAVKTLVIKLC